MAQLDDFSRILLLVTGALLVAAAAEPLALRARLPAPAAFLALGVVVGLLDPGLTRELSALDIQRVGTVALYAILFHGGLATGMGAARRRYRSILLLGLPGTVATAVGVAAVARYALGLSGSLSLVVGIALAPTDPAAVYAALRDRADTAARTILEGESGVNDPVGIAFMVALVAHLAQTGGQPGGVAGTLALELLVGTVGGVVGGLLLRAALPLVESAHGGSKPVVLVAAAVAVGSATTLVHGSGFLAVYLCGLILSDAWSQIAGSHVTEPESIAAAAEPLLFALLGAVFAPLVGAGALLEGSVLALCIALVVRPIVATVCLWRSGLARGERAVIAWGGLKGAVPLLLAGLPALEHLGVSSRAAAIVLVATAVSIVLQGATLPRVFRAALGPEDAGADAPP